MDSEKSAVRTESAFATLGCLSSVLSHVQGALAAWCDPSRSSPEVVPPSPQTLQELFNLANYLTAHISRLSFKAKAEVVLERRHRFSEAVRAGIPAFAAQAKEGQTKLNFIPAGAEENLTLEAPLHKEVLFARTWSKYIKGALAKTRCGC